MFDLVVPSTRAKPISYLLAGSLFDLVLVSLAQASVSLPQGGKQEVSKSCTIGSGMLVGFVEAQLKPN